MKPKFYFLILIVSILTIIFSSFQIIGSFPITTLMNNLKRGGSYVETNQIHITRVISSTPASVAGLAVGDIIVSVNGRNMYKTNDFIEIIRQNKGSVIEIVVNRNGEIEKVKLASRISYPPYEGATGVMITNQELKKESAISIISSSILREISWDITGRDIAGPIGIFIEKEYFRPIILLIGVFSIVLSVGLIKLKKWALYGTLLFAVIDLIQNINFFYSVRFSSTIFISIFFFSISILYVFYLYSQRIFFR